MTQLQSICLIIPPSVFLLDERVFMSLGILKVAIVLERFGYSVELLDLSGVENYADAVRQHAHNTQATAFGITSTTPQMPAAVRILQTIRDVKPCAKVILGGPHITLVQTAYQSEASRHQLGRAAVTFRSLSNLFDVLVSGDGEEAVLEALKDNAPKLINANDRNSPLFLSSQKLDRLPYPARHLVDVDSYHYSIEGHKALSLIAQLGCPFECGFCGGRESAMLRVIRTRSTQNIVGEIREMYETYGVTGFMFYDDELNVSPKIAELMEGIAMLQKELGVKFHLRGFIKAQLFNEKQAEAMYKAGFRWILTGFESGSPRILANMNKKAAREDNTHCVKVAKDHGLKVKALMSIGHPGESDQTVRDTRDWLLEVRPDDFDVTIITTYPGSPYYDFAIRDSKQNDIWVYTCKTTGDKLYSLEVDYNKVANYYKGDPEGGYQAYVFTDHLSREDLVALRDKTEREVRKKLNIPFNPSATAIRYEHSMGQLGKALPPSMLRTSFPYPRAVNE